MLPDRPDRPDGSARPLPPSSPGGPTTNQPTPCPSTGMKSPPVASPAAQMPTDADLQVQLDVLLRSSDLNVVTPKLLRASLEEH